MARPKQNEPRIDDQADAPERAIRPRALERGDTIEPMGESPALRLQNRLADAYGVREGKWSPRRTLMFIILVCGGFWLLLFAGLRAFLR